MLQFNALKIYISANEAKPGGSIGAMLSPYLFSTNMSDFCKRFNEQSKDYLIGVWLPVKVTCDTINKVYTFFIKPVTFSMFFINVFNEGQFILIGFLYDLVLFYSGLYKIDLYRSSLLIFNLLKSFRKRHCIIKLSDWLKLRLKNII